MPVEITWDNGYEEYIKYDFTTDQFDFSARDITSDDIDIVINVVAMMKTNIKLIAAPSIKNWMSFNHELMDSYRDGITESLDKLKENK